ncbi:MAG: putative AlkP superfamily pyrophosphatase or phosphodiesterase [Alphaproteobacteria bacterium]|jgi:predicted AlkP superfamily pyrophosphatase or phosphodiesterase
MSFAGNTPHDDRIQQVLEWLYLPDEQRPEFLSLYFSVVDSAGHRHGPDYPKVIEALQEVDRALGLLIEGIEQRGLFNKMHILVTSDHGMETVAMDRYVLIDEFIDLSRVHFSDWTPIAQIWETEDGLSTDEIFEGLNGAHPNMRVWKKADVPTRYHFNKHERVADVIAEVDLGWMISSKPYYAEMKPNALNGMHGWDSAWHNMHGIFIAHGPAFAPGTRAPTVRSIDLYSLMAELMQIKPADNDGSLTAFAPILYNPQPASIRTSDWVCDNAELVLREGQGLASLQRGEQIFSLPLKVSASGVRYEDTDVLFWSKGNKAEVVIDGQALTNCSDVAKIILE